MSTDPIRAKDTSAPKAKPAPPRDPIEMLRASVRPLVTLMLVGWTLHLVTVVVNRLFDAKMYGEGIATLGGLMTMTGIVVAFYYRARDAQRQVPPS